MVELLPEIPSLPLAKLRKIGTDYLLQYPEASLLHDNQDLAKKLQEFPEASTDIEKWVSLLDMYFQLKPGATLKKAIAAQVEDCFGREITAVHRAITYQRGVSSIWLWHIGNEYLQKHPVRDSGLAFFNAHTNQPYAERLIEHAHSFRGRKSWIYLYLTYKSLPNQKGHLAQTIRNIFNHHFHDAFDNIVSFLELNQHTAKSLQTMPDDGFDLALSQETEERFYQQQIDKMFAIKRPSLSAFEEASIFWVKRTPYVRLVAAGVIIIAPVAAVLFLTANVYAILFMGIITGGGTLVMEMVGQTGIKVEIVPDNVWELMRENQKEFGLNNIRFKHSLEENMVQLRVLHEQLDKQGLLLKEHESLVASHEQNNKQQKAEMDRLNQNLSILSGLTTQLTSSLQMSEQEKARFITNLESVCSSNATIAGEALANMSSLANERQKIASHNLQLQSELNRLSRFLLELKAIVDNSSSLTSRQEAVAHFFENLANSIGLQISDEPKPSMVTQHLLDIGLEPLKLPSYPSHS
ncbi:MAG: hypothetical protein JJT82_09485 [Legionellaceae bacterium]|nr:hypothetical protein [Legionellaceae bacterium]